MFLDLPPSCHGCQAAIPICPCGPALGESTVRKPRPYQASEWYASTPLVSPCYYPSMIILASLIIAAALIICIVIWRFAPTEPEYQPVVSGPPPVDTLAIITLINEQQSALLDRFAEVVQSTTAAVSQTVVMPNRMQFPNAIQSIPVPLHSRPDLDEIDGADPLDQLMHNPYYKDPTVPSAGIAALDDDNPFGIPGLGEDKGDGMHSASR